MFAHKKLYLNHDDYYYEIILRNISSGEIVKTWNPIYFSPVIVSNEKIAFINYNKIEIFDLNTEETSTLGTISSRILKNLGSNYLANSSLDHVTIWNYETRKSFEIATKSDDILLLSSGKLAISSNDIISIWDFNNKKCIKSFQSNLGSHHLLTELPNNQLACVNNRSNTLYLFDVNLGQCINKVVFEKEDILNLKLFESQLYIYCSYKSSDDQHCIKVIKLDFSLQKSLDKVTELNLSNSDSPKL